MTDPYRWDDMRVFLTLWRAGSLLAASTALGVNPSTVGRRLDALEEALSVQLFERTPEGVIATLAAEQLVPFAESIERSHHDFSHALHGLEREPEGPVRVTGPPGLIDYFVAPAIAELLEHFPKLRVVLDASIGYADLSRGEADIALRGKRPDRGDLVVQQLGPFGSCVVGARHLYAGNKPVAGFDALPWIQWGEELAHIPDARFIDANVEDQSIVLRTSSFAAQVEAARAGVGVLWGAKPFADLDGLCEVRVRGGKKSADQYLYLVGHQALRRVPRIAVVWDFLRDRFTAM